MQAILAPLYSLTGRVRCEAAQPQPHSHATHAGFTQYPANAPIEDRVAFGNFGNFATLAVFDGHGGWQVAEKLRTSLSHHIRRAVEKFPASKEQALREAFREADAEVRGLVAPAYNLGFSKLARVGACGLVVLVDEQGFTVANAGDCKGVLVRKGGPVSLNFQHNANDPLEQERLRKLHPEETDVVKCKREWTEKTPIGWFRSQEVRKFSGCYVKGMLQPTKVFGDFYLKEEALGFDFDRQRTFVNPAQPKSFPYVTSEPDVGFFPRAAGDQLIVLGSDGLWDELSEQEVAAVASEALDKGASAEAISQRLIDAALAKAAEAAKMRVEDLKRLPQGRDRRSLHDDISVVVLVL